jgi:hypothetical protein
MLQERIDFPSLDFETTQLGNLDKALRASLVESGISETTAESVDIVFMKGSIIAELNMRVREEIATVQANKATIRATTMAYYLAYTLPEEEDTSYGDALLVASTASDDSTAAGSMMALIICLALVVVALVFTAFFAIRKLNKSESYDLNHPAPEPVLDHTYMELHAGDLTVGGGEDSLAFPTLGTPARREGFPTPGGHQSYGVEHAKRLSDDELNAIRKRTDQSLADALDHHVLDVIRDDGRKMSLTPM